MNQKKKCVWTFFVWFQQDLYKKQIFTKNEMYEALFQIS